MYIWNKTISKITQDKVWRRTLAITPYNEKLVIARFDLGTWFDAYEVCKYNSTAGWYTWCAGKIVSFLDPDCTPVDWVYITEKEAYEILGVDCDEVNRKRHNIYNEYKEYINCFVNEGCICNPEEGIYASPLSFNDWLGNKDIDIQRLFQCKE